MLAILHLLRSLLADLFKSRSRLEAENLFLRHQLNITLRRHYLGLDCAVAIGLCCLDGSNVSRAAPFGSGGEAGNGFAVASGWVQGFLALEISV